MENKTIMLQDRYSSDPDEFDVFEGQNDINRRKKLCSIRIQKKPGDKIFKNLSKMMSKKLFKNKSFDFSKNWIDK